MQRLGLGWGCSNPRIWYKLLICPSEWTSGLWRFLFYLSFHFFPLSSFPVHVSSIRMRIEYDHFHDRLKASAICSSFEERNFKLMCIEFSSSWSFQSITFLQSYTNYIDEKNKPQPRTVWCLIFYFCISPRTYKRGRGFFKIFFLGDRTSAPDVFISCSFTSLARILRQVQWWSVSMVTRYDAISSRCSSQFWVKIYFSSTSFNNKSKFRG